MADLTSKRTTTGKTAFRAHHQCLIGAPQNQLEFRYPQSTTKSEIDMPNFDVNSDIQEIPKLVPLNQIFADFMTVLSEGGIPHQVGEAPDCQSVSNMLITGF